MLLGCNIFKEPSKKERYAFTTVGACSIRGDGCRSLRCCFENPEPVKIKNRIPDCLRAEKKRKQLFYIVLFCGITDVRRGISTAHTVPLEILAIINFLY